MTLQIYKIASTEVGSAGASSIDFTSIPQGYRDLKLVLTTRLTYSTNIYGKLKITFNGSASTYTTRQLYGDGQNTPASVVQTNTDMSLTAATGAETANAFGSTEMYIPNYAGSTAKSFSIDGVNETNAQNAVTELCAGLWNGTSAISSIKIEAGSNGGTFVQYSKVTLYGIL